MSISPPSDIVLDVARAADPSKYRAALESLAKISGTSEQAAENAVASMIDELASNAAARARKAISSASISTNAASEKQAPEALGKNQLGAMPARSHDPQADPYKQFEAFFLQNFVEAMLPKDSEALFGKGPGGNIWKSMLAEHMANELASSTAFGIAEQIADHRKEKQRTASAATASSDAAPPSLQGGEAGNYLSDLKRVLAAQGEQLSASPDRLHGA